MRFPSKALSPVLALLLAAGIGCAGMPGGTAEPTTPWSQALVTQLSSKLSTELSSLYETARREPAFAGERTAYGGMLDQLRILKQESAGLHQMLEDGKGLAETEGRYERIKEVSRDLQESESWTFLPDDFSAKAKATLAALDSLDAYYGAP